MNVSLRNFFAGLMVCFWALTTTAQAADGPDKIVGDATGKVIQLLKTERAVYEKNPGKFYDDVEQIIDPVIAFDEMGRGVMGKYAHRATDAEIARFTKVFRDSLVTFYSKAVLTFDTSQLTLGKVDSVSADTLKAYEAGKSRSIPVGLKIRSKDTEYAMSYSVMKKDGQWKVRNIVVEGINIGIQFRNQFQDAMNKYRSVATVIDKWPSLMQQETDQQQKELKEKEKAKS
ncbi:ABC transporter substrate-binding protein [Sansalvadorimonas sp. 2012CJ34-2]|uniref:ABC transporter substrate-binding protein n=1 Tax=Parendozoicomonas callyspongiae TaxID=2942213 RepID=A0ABT0PBX7_9GAMM|nr:ABC transporter substrate-binding protein [Sansalvadorimonas sp. 2012CJ34-2]MCL6268884.1 ABC transporter substrate-binding protein [Sansalvadorimonas sp. 2012CJ34-2]